MDKSLSWLSFVQHSGNFMRTLRNGKRQNPYNYQNKDGSCMSKLRQSFLECLRVLGNHSGCHQLPERSFFYKGKQFPVCARCTGVFIGQLTAVITAPWNRIPASVAFFLLGLMGLDWSVQALKIKPSTNIRRFITGIMGGLGLFRLYIILFKKIFL